MTKVLVMSMCDSLLVIFFYPVFVLFLLCLVCFNAVFLFYVLFWLLVFLLVDNDFDCLNLFVKIYR